MPPLYGPLPRAPRAQVTGLTRPHDAPAPTLTLPARLRTQVTMHAVLIAFLALAVCAAAQPNTGFVGDNWAGNLGLTILDGLLNNVEAFLQGGLATVSGLVYDVMDFFATTFFGFADALLTQVDDIVSNGFDAVFNLWDMVAAFVASLLGSVEGALAPPIGSVVEALLQIFSLLVPYFG